MRAVRAFGLLEYSRSRARSWSCDESCGERSASGSALTNAGSRPQGAGRFYPTKKQVLMRKAHRCDARGAGPWPTRCTPKVRTAREPPGTKRPLRRAPWRTQRIRFCIPLKSRFSRARRTEPMCTGVHEAPWNAAREVLPPSSWRGSRYRGCRRASSPAAASRWTTATRR